MHINSRFFSALGAEETTALDAASLAENSLPMKAEKIIQTAASLNKETHKIYSDRPLPDYKNKIVW